MPDTSQNEPAHAEESSLVWPPTGFRAYYTVSERIADEPEVSYDLVLPGTSLKSISRQCAWGGTADRVTPTVGFGQNCTGGSVGRGRRRSGRDDDEAAAASAHSATEGPLLDRGPQKLREQCDASDSRRKLLAEILDWSEEQEIKRRRDNVVHADWWDFAGCGVRRSRFARGKNGETILASLADLEEDAHLLFEYASRLDKLLGNDWIIARLPEPFRSREGATAATLPNPS